MDRWMGCIFKSSYSLNLLLTSSHNRCKVYFFLASSCQIYTHNQWTETRVEWKFMIMETCKVYAIILRFFSFPAWSNFETGNNMIVSFE